MVLEKTLRCRIGVLVVPLILTAAFGIPVALCQRGDAAKLPGPCRAALISKQGTGSKGGQIFVHSLDISKACPTAMHRGTSVRWTVRGDGIIEKVEMLKSSKCLLWDKEVMEKAKAREFPEAKLCGPFVVEAVVSPDLFSK